MSLLTTRYRLSVAHRLLIKRISPRRTLSLHAATFFNTNAAPIFLKPVELRRCQQGSRARVRARCTETSWGTLDRIPPGLDWLAVTFAAAFQQFITKDLDRGFTRGPPLCSINGSCKGLTAHINSQRRGTENSVSAMASDPSSQVAHCPCCLCPLDTRQRYSVQVCLPAHPSYPPGVPNLQAHANAMMHPSLSSTPHHHHDHHHIDTPAPPYEPPRHSQPVQSGQGQVSHREHHHPPAPSSSGYQQPTEGGQDRATRTQSDHPPNSPSSDPQPVEGGLGRALRAQTNPLSTPSTPIDQQPTGGEQGDITDREDRRSSTSSSSTVYSEFSEYSINSDIAAGLQAVEDIYFPPQRSQSNSSPPPLPPLSSPPTEVSTLPNSSPPPESPSTQPISDGPPPTLRRWAVFRGRVPGIYASA